MTDRKYCFPRGRNAGLRAKGPKAAAPSAASKENLSCDPMTPTCIAAASASAVSPAISLPVSPASSREQQKIETQGSQCSNQSGSNPNRAKPNCYACQHRRELVGDAHSRCANPRVSDEAEAIAMCNANNYALRTLGPWEVVPVAEIREAQPVSQRGEE